jgi:three-Cys-motif partner protein
LLCFNGYVPLPQSTLWPIEPHTEAKHKILRKYLEAWFPIMTSSNPRIVYLDGFSGPGRYTGGQPGSPILALECAKNHRAALKGELVFLFIEVRKDRADHLSTQIEQLHCPDRFKIDVKCGEFALKLTEILDSLGRDGHRIAPTFALIDPFGFSGIPYTLIQRLLSNHRCEVFISFMVDSINRWLEHPDEVIRAHIKETFGIDEPFAIARGAADRIVALKDLYHHQLTKIASFVRSFELRDKNDRVVYYLFFASNNATGHYKMKEAMWKVDPLGDFSFSDATNPNQSILFLNAPLEILRSDLIQQFRATGEVPIERVETFIFNETGFLRKHMREVLENLESEGQVKIAPFKTNGKRRLRKTYPNDALITFL